MYKPRGPQKPAFRKENMEGLSLNKLIHFFEECQRELNDAGYEDSAFYFEQLQEYFRNGNKPRMGLAAAHRVLGL